MWQPQELFSPAPSGLCVGYSEWFAWRPSPTGKLGFWHALINDKKCLRLRHQGNCVLNSPHPVRLSQLEAQWLYCSKSWLCCLPESLICGTWKWFWRKGQPWRSSRFRVLEMSIHLMVPEMGACLPRIKHRFPVAAAISTLTRPCTSHPSAFSLPSLRPTLFNSLIIMKFATFILTFLMAAASVSFALGLTVEIRETNAQRMARGLSPLPPRGLGTRSSLLEGKFKSYINRCLVFD